jgi:hypothetical protein
MCPEMATEQAGHAQVVLPISGQISVGLSGQIAIPIVSNPGLKLWAHIYGRFAAQNPSPYHFEHNRGNFWDDDD